MKNRITPPQIAKREGVNAAKVIAWIRSGQLIAINMATKLSGRPRYEIEESAWQDFLDRRRTKPPEPKPPRRQRQAATKDFFPEGT